MILYENGSQCLEIYQKSGENIFLPRELLVRKHRLPFLQSLGKSHQRQPDFLAVQNEKSNCKC